MLILTFALIISVAHRTGVDDCNIIIYKMWQSQVEKEHYSEYFLNIFDFALSQLNK